MLLPQNQSLITLNPSPSHLLTKITGILFYWQVSFLYSLLDNFLQHTTMMLHDLTIIIKKFSLSHFLSNTDNLPCSSLKQNSSTQLSLLCLHFLFSYFLSNPFQGGVSPQQFNETIFVRVPIDIQVAKSKGQFSALIWLSYQQSLTQSVSLSSSIHSSSSGFQVTTHTCAFLL